MRKFLSFGNLNLNNLVKRLFWFGIIPIALYSYVFVNYFFPTGTSVNTVDEIIQQSKQGSSVTMSVPLYYSPLISLFILAITFLSSVVIWKLICEIIFNTLRYLDNSKNT